MDRTTRILSFVIRVAALTLAPAIAHAGGFVRVPTFDSPPVCTSLPLCASDAECTGGTSCIAFGTQGSYCALPGQDLFCCDSGATCPTVDGVANMCVSVATDSGSISLCLPPDPRVCPSGTGGSPTWAQFEACYRSAVTRTGHVYDWEVGDCDGDGIVNGRDSAPCVPMLDAGPVADVLVVDDAVLVDSSDDVTSARDAGVVDAVVHTDANSTDAAMDAGAETGGAPDEIPQVTFHGGGCQCNAGAHNERSSAGFGSLLLALGAVSFSRRRARGH